MELETQLYVNRHLHATFSPDRLDALYRYINGVKLNGASSIMGLTRISGF
jgi:hypothetical protein